MGNKMFNFEGLKNGFPQKRSGWGGYWKWENNTIMIYCKDGKVLDIRETDDVNFTISNLLAEDWELATNKNCIIEVK